MIGIILLACIALYLALFVGVIVLVGKWAKKRGRRRWPWCTAAGIFMYLLVAWEQIPTYVIGRYYCATQAGVTVYKTPNEWLIENPGLENTLVWQKVPSRRYIRDGESDVSLNQRLVYSIRRHLMSVLPVNITTREIHDSYDKSVLVREVAVSTGYDKRGGMGALAFKVWAGNFLCSPGYSDFLSVMRDYAEIGREAD
ncbi:hypothetical protein [Stutzerimonas nosocomialis]|uniref:hypothetical protein n=1 Tax=Stutzerimonas nosocomialis TaxID=1056496 RepID=UPI001108826C|nr:hypothetical protein [Stutzerimonas nosocomialis]